MPTATPLVLVLGAGASKEVNLPLGSELKEKISEVLNFKVDDFGQVAGGDPKLRECLHRLAQAGGGSINDYFQAACTIHDAMPLAQSIDNFIDSHRGSPRITEVGKLAIARCIQKAERGSKLFVDLSNSYNKPDFSKLSGTWFNAIFGILLQHCSWENIEERLGRLAIISFNYDRCAKQFFREALKTYYRVPQQEVDRVISKVAIYHPYGSVGPMRYQTGGPGVDFGEEPMSDELTKYSQQLKTFTEGTDESSSEIASIRSTVRSARALVFLGFAFHPLNMKLLFGDERPDPGFDAGDVFATAMGISESDTQVISNELRSFGGYTENRVRLRRDLVAANLVNEYSRHLSQAVRAAA
jgi:hypothetical protein